MRSMLWLVIWSFGSHEGRGNSDAASQGVFQAVRTGTAGVLQNPLKAAVDSRWEYEVTLVLKGSTTIIADQFGNATLVCVGTPGMAKGGSGDVLTGIIAGFAAQGKDPYEAALAGVYIAGMAGERAAELEGEYSMTPMDAVNSIGYAIDQITVDYITADTVKKREKSVKPSDLQEALPKEEKPEKRKEQEEEPAEEMPIEEPELPEPEEEFSEEVVTGKQRLSGACKGKKFRFP